MATQIKTPAKSETVTQPPEAVEVPQMVTIELARMERYFLVQGNTLFTRRNPQDQNRRQTYTMTKEDARPLMALRDPLGLPVFRLAKPGTRASAAEPVPVQRPDGELDSAMDRWLNTPADGIDLSDDDPELAARLAALDQQDAGTGVTV
jgi:hypothetical protein